MTKTMKKIMGARKAHQNKKKVIGRMANRSAPAFGAISTITTAPVAIGNSMSGAKAQVIQTSTDQVRVVGRDYAYTATPTGDSTGWCLAGGVPLTPACFVSSVLRSYTQIYNKFKFNRVAFHYITSSPTSSTGDVMFQVNANRADPHAVWTANTFLPYALSKPETIIGPQWTNHSMSITPKGPYKTLVLGQNGDIDYSSQGEVMFYSKTTTGESPGYILIDYDVTFAEMSINPRSGVLPNPNIVYQPIQLIFPNSALTSNTTVLTLTTGTTWIGGTAISNIVNNANFKVGDVFKIALDTTNTLTTAWTSTVSTPTLANLMSSIIDGTQETMALTDGYTLYAAFKSSTTCVLYTSAAAAFAASNPIRAGSTYTPAVYAAASNVPTAGVWLYAQASWVGNLLSNNLQQV